MENNKESVIPTSLGLSMAVAGQDVSEPHPMEVLGRLAVYALEVLDPTGERGVKLSDVEAWIDKQFGVFWNERDREQSGSRRGKPHGKPYWYHRLQVAFNRLRIEGRVTFSDGLWFLRTEATESSEQQGLTDNAKLDE